MSTLNKIDYFYEASGWFLTENLTWEELDKLGHDGIPLPLSEDYENWDFDYVEERIEMLAEDMERIAKKAVLICIQNN